MIFNRKANANGAPMVSAMQFYFEWFFQKITGGHAPSDRPPSDRPLEEGQFFYSTNRIYTSEGIKKVFFLNDLPHQVSASLFYDLKNAVEKYGTLFIQEYSEPYDLNLNNPRKRAQVMMWENRANEVAKKLKTQTVSQEILKKESDKIADENTLRMIESWKMIDRANRNQQKFCNVRYILELIATNEKNFMLAEDALTSALKYQKIRYGDAFLLTNEYYQSFSPASSEAHGLLSDKYPGNVFTDELIAAFTYPTQGIVGDPYGLLFGVDKFTFLPVTVNLKKDEKAFNALIAAVTGHGKSGLIKGLVNFIEIDDDFYIILNDYEGDEYDALGAAYGATTIDVSGKSESSCYFDTTEIGDLTGDPKIDYDLKNQSMSITRVVFDLLCDEEKGMNHKELAIFNDAYNLMNHKFGITDDKRTWHNSKKTSYHELFRTIVNMTTDKRRLALYKDTIFDMIDKLRVYFDPDGMYAYLFKRRISINSILGKKFIIFSFGERGRSEITNVSMITALKQLFFSYTSNLIANYNKSVLKGWTFVVFEEFQRYMHRQSTGQIVVDHVTGGRKRNELCFLVTNAPKELIENSEKDSEKASLMKTISENIQCKLIGYVEEDVINTLCNFFTIQDSAPMLQKMRDNQEEYENCFLFSYRNENAVIKMQVPPEVLNSQLFRTRQTEEDLKRAKVKERDKSQKAVSR